MSILAKRDLGNTLKYKKESTLFLDSDGSFNPLLDSGESDKAIKVKVPVHLRDFVVPSNIKSFLTDLMPNMEIYVGSQLTKYTSYRGKDITMEIITHFMTYILGTCSSKNGSVKRYELYNPKKFSKIPYYRWIFTNLGFFVTKFRQAQFSMKKMEAFQYSLESSTFDGDESRSYMENEASLSCSKMNAEDELISNEITDKCLTCLHSFVSRVSQDDPKTSYIKMINIYEYMIDGFTKQKISKILGIESNIVAQNIAKIKEVLINEFPKLHEELIAA